MPRNYVKKSRRSNDKSKGSHLHVDEDYESDEDYIDRTETLLAKRNRSRTARPRSVSRRKNVLKLTGSVKHRPQSAPPNRTGRNLWLASIKQGYTSSSQVSPRHKTSTEYFVDTLRKTGHGISSESNNMNTMTGLKKRDNVHMAYLSTPSYMRQMMGTEKGRPLNDPTAKSAAGTPTYRTQEEYYDQILELKKQIGVMVQENNSMKAKVRRLEEDNIKKEKEIGGLLDPLKSDDIRRTLGDKRPDSGAVIHSLKQKIMKLEVQVRDKESSFVKLQSDIKTTKVEELRLEMEVMYEEIVRLRNSSHIQMDKSTKLGRGSSTKNKALNETIKLLAGEKEHLMAENRALKDDLQNAFEEKDKDISQKDYEDMNKKQLLKTIGKLEKKLSISDRRYDDSASIISYDNKKSNFSGKIQLEGSLQDRLDHLDQRESELLLELEKCRNSIKQLKENREHLKAKCEDKDKEIRSLRKKLGQSDRLSDVDSHTDRARQKSYSPRQSLRPDSARSRGSVESTESESRRKMLQIRQTRAARSIQRGWKDRQNKLKREKELNEQNEQMAQDFRRNRAAKKIQRQWSGYQYSKHDDELDDATELLQAAFQGHSMRKSHLRSYISDDEDADSYTGAVSVVQSSLKGHLARKEQLKNLHQPSDGDESDNTYQSAFKFSKTPKRPPSAASRGSVFSKDGSVSRRSSGLTSKTFTHKGNYNNYNDDDDIEF